MRLETAIYTSASGLTGYGTAIGVIGDNIANSNTTGYKTSRPEFVDVLGTAQNDRNSGVNSSGGSGVQVSSIRTVFDSGIVENTSRQLDVAISGNGFFQVGTTDDPHYTRVGSFQISTEGLLATPDGQPVLGLQGTGTTLGTLNMYDVTTAGKPTASMIMYGNLNSREEDTLPPTGTITEYSDLSGANFQTAQTVYDSLGARHDVQLFFFKKADNTWTVQTYMDGGDVGGTKGVPTKVAPDATLNFSGNGTINDANAAAAQITATAAFSGGASPGSFKIDLSNFSQYAANSILNNISQDGQSSGNIKGYQFDSDGTVSAVLDTGTTSVIGKIQLALFPNLDGLTRNGSGTFTPTDKAGTVFVDTPGKGQFGTLSGGALERSTVDLADQFANLIILQRSYQANASMMRTTNQILEQTTNLLG